MVQTEQRFPDHRGIWAEVVARAWRDPDYKAALLADPAQVLAEAGLIIPTGLSVFAHENTTTEYHFVVPRKPDDPADLLEYYGGDVQSFNITEF